MDICTKSGERMAADEHMGFGYECNASLAFNSGFSPTWFAIPSMARCNSGREYSEQTHDL